MPTIMSKYKFNDKDYLVYDKNILSKDFTKSEWSMLTNGEYGVGADFVIIFDANEIHFYNAKGIEIIPSLDNQTVAKYHQSKNTKINRQIVRDIEVRFTDYYINSIISKLKKRAFIA